MPLEYSRLPATRIAEIASQENVIAVIPLGSLEQHCEGPLGLDALIVERLSYEACSIAEMRGEIKCVILPTIYYGYSPEWSRVKGTISIPLYTYQKLVKSVIEGLVKAEFKRIALINGHGGNTSPLEALIRDLTTKFNNVLIALINYWELQELKLDHAGPVEEWIAKTLGITGDLGKCEEIAYRSRPRIITRAPVDPVRILTAEVEVEKKSLEPLIESIAAALERLLKIDISKPSI